MSPISRASSFALLTICLHQGMSVLNSTASAQATSPAIAQQAESWGEVQAEELWRILQGQAVYDPSGAWIGRVVGLTADPGTRQLQVTVRLRPRHGGRNHRMPLAGFRRVAGRLVAPATPAQMRRGGAAR